MKLDLLRQDELPKSFAYPHAFVRAAELGVVNLEPWALLEGEVLRRQFTGLRQRYRSREFIPFAGRQDADDVACWSAANPGPVFVVHDFASSGSEIDCEFDGFLSWLRQAVEDFIDWHS